MSETSSQLSFKFALLHLIEETDKFHRATERLQQRYGPYFTEAEKFEALYHASCKSINQGLQHIGGLDVIVDATDITPELPLKLIEWKGEHPVAPDRHQWLGFHAASHNHVEVTLGSEAIQEIREKLLVEEVD